MKKQSITFLLTMLVSMVGVQSFAHNFAVANSDGVTIYYNYINNNTELEVTYRGSYSNSYPNRYTGNVVIPESVTNNGTTYSVTSIGWHAFQNCSALTSVTIPNSVTSIGSSAFYECSALTSVTIPNSVTVIGSSAFEGCSALTSVTIPNSVTSIGGSAFYGTAWHNNQPDGLIYAGKVAYKYKGTMPSNTSIVLEKGTLGIAGGAFSGCSDLTSVTIPNSVTSIGGSAFSGCSGLKEVYFNATNCASMANVFSNCSALTKLFVGDNVTNIPNNAFYGCSGLMSVTIPNSVTSIGSGAFEYCKSLESVTIGTGVLSIGSGVFGGHRPAKVIWLTNTPPRGYTDAAGTVNYVANDQYSFSYYGYNRTVYKFLSSTFEVDGVKYVPVSPSERTCDAIDCTYEPTAENINIGETVVYKGVNMKVNQILPYTCFNNQYIKNVKVYCSSELSEHSFQRCRNVQTVTLGEKVTGIGASAFSGCSSLQSIIIPDAVKTMGQYAFSGCSSMKSAKMGTGVETIENYTFSNCSALTDMKIGSSVKSINTYAFNGCSSLPLIEIPKSVTKIDNYVFSGCTALKDVYIADRTTELSLGSNGSSPLFADCPLDSVYIGGDISYNKSSSYGYSPFYRNTSLRAVHITDQETEISENEFYGCTGLKNVRIGDGVTTIGNWAFSGCSSLSYFAFGSSLQTIGQEAFSDCTAVGEIISKAATPPTCGSQAIDDISKWECKLFVPEGTLATYQQADQWKDFFFAEEGAGSGNPGIHEAEKCATPVITFADGKLKFTCATAGVEYHYDITADGSKSGTGSQTDLTTTYTISVYASKEGFDNSETVRKTITTGGTGGQVGDVNGDGEVNAVDLTKLIEILLKR